MGDVGFVGNFDEAAPSKQGNGIEGYLSRGVIETGVTRSSEQTGLLLTRLWSQSPKAYKNNYTLRGRTRLRVSLIPCSQWYNLGPWL